MIEENNLRIESDSMGDLEIPNDVLYGASTQRAVSNFPISGMRMPRYFIHSLVLIKKVCALVNRDLGRLEADVAKLIVESCDEILGGDHDDQFVVEVFQTGSGTSSNMNVNEVISNLCCRNSGKPLGSKVPAHPNDHVNMSQSSNDVVPSSLHLSVVQALSAELIPAIHSMGVALSRKSKEWKDVVKIGRTHFMDATPITMGQVFSGYARQMEKASQRVERGMALFHELPIGGTAVGTGLNAPDEFGKMVCRRLSEETGIDYREAENHFELQSARDDCVELAGILATVSASFAKIASDIRIMGSGPRGGLAELKLPEIQPGSSIMPGKVNPVMCEMAIQVTHYVSGLCHTIRRCGQDGQLELNVTIPLITHTIHEAVRCLSTAIKTFEEKCIKDLEVDEEHCKAMSRRSLMLATALNPIIGYEKSAEVAKKAFEEDKELAAAVVELGYLDEDEANECLDPLRMI